MKDTPIFINSKDRYSYLKKLVTRLEELETTNITIVDTGSTYPPMLEYYETLKYPIKRLGNVQTDAHHALWNCGLMPDGWFVYTDCDVVPMEECPKDYLDFFYASLMKYPQKVKIGFGLHIEDIPDHYKHKHVLPGEDVGLHPGVLEWEAHFWQNPIDNLLYDADIDTTFALYRPGTIGRTGQPAIRTGHPYAARHLTWYTNSSNLTEEEIYYKAHVVPGVSSWGI